MKLPSAKSIVLACKAVGQPRTNNTVRGWTCGRRCPPVWVSMAIAEYICPEDTIRIAGEISDELTRRWRAKHPTT